MICDQGLVAVLYDIHKSFSHAVERESGWFLGILSHIRCTHKYASLAASLFIHLETLIEDTGYSDPHCCDSILDGLHRPRKW